MTPKLSATPIPDFRSREFLRQHIADIMNFYHPRCMDPVGGYFQYFRDDGSIYDTRRRHLVGSARFVFNFAMAARHLGGPRFAEAARHGLAYLRDMHRDSTTGGYVWTLFDGLAEDRTNHCYGIAFVLLAYASAHKAGSEHAEQWMDETWELLEERYWDESAQLYRDCADADWNFSPRRRQNANMHLCEAMLRAYESSGNPRYLDRALLLADRVTRSLASQSNGLIWEDYDAHWKADLSRPADVSGQAPHAWGFQSGHQSAWAKLLLILDRHCRRPAADHARPTSVPGAVEPPLQPVPARHVSPETNTPHAGVLDPQAGERTTAPDWLVPTARRLFDTAVPLAWDKSHGGLCLAFDADGEICNDDKSHRSHTETLAAAALLAHRTDVEAYWLWYERIWTYAWEHMIDHQYGGWYRVLDGMNQKYDDRKSPAGKTDYHAMNACYEVLNVIG